MDSKRGNSFCFVHAADLHLDTPFSGIHATSPVVAEALREASLEAFDSIVELALERDAAFLLVAGDVYDGAERGLRAQLRFRDGLARLSRAGIASFVVHGNHDPVSTGWSAIRRWPDDVTVFGHEGVRVVPVVRGGTRIATVQGISYATPRTTDNLALGFSRPDGPGPHVGLLHCNVQGAATGHADYSPCTLEDLRRSGLDYLALGHVHQHRVLARGTDPGDTWVVYSGSSQARSPKPTEQGPKGALVAHVDDGRVTAVENLACDRVRFATLEAMIDDLEGVEQLEDRLIAGAADARVRADGRSLVLRARLGGRGALHADLARPGVLEDLVRHLRESTLVETGFCWWDAVEDLTSLAIDLDTARARGDFASDLVALAEGITEDERLCTELAETTCSRASMPRSLAGDLARVLGDTDRLRELIARATTIALDTLTDGDR